MLRFVVDVSVVVVVLNLKLHHQQLVCIERITFTVANLIVDSRLDQINSEPSSGQKFELCFYRQA